jgi:hypothetical protein
VCRGGAARERDDNISFVVPMLGERRVWRQRGDHGDPRLSVYLSSLLG